MPKLSNPQPNLSGYWLNFDETLQIGSWEHLEQITNCHSDIYPGNICSGDICTYQEYLSCYWPDFDETLNVASWEHLEQIPTIKFSFAHAIFVLVTSVGIRNISAVTDPILIKL